MAGHYVLSNFTKRLMKRMNEILGIEGLDQEICHPNGGIMKHDKNHYYQGWTKDSYSLLSNCINDKGTVSDRSGLPPHKYYEINKNNPNIGKLIYRSDIKLIRTDNFHLHDLSEVALEEWNNMNPMKSLAEQVKDGDVRLEIYYIDGICVGEK